MYSWLLKIFLAEKADDSGIFTEFLDRKNIWLCLINVLYLSSATYEFLRLSGNPSGSSPELSQITAILMVKYQANALWSLKKFF